MAAFHCICFVARTTLRGRVERSSLRPPDFCKVCIIITIILINMSIIMVTIVLILLSMVIII